MGPIIVSHEVIIPDQRHFLLYANHCCM